MIRRKQHSELAKILRNHKFNYLTMTPRDVATDIANFLMKDNPTFDRSKFMREAGYYDE